MPKAFTTRLPLMVSCRIWLRSAKRARLFSRGMANARGQICHRPHDEGNQNRRADGHFPIHEKKHEDKGDQ